MPLSEAHKPLRKRWEHEFPLIGVEVLFDDGPENIGQKRQQMLLKATGDYVVFIDADDEIAENYLDEVIRAIRTGPDAIGFRGHMTTNGRKRQDFWISKTLPYISTDQYHFRHTNHLCPIKRNLALLIGYKPISFGEDYDYAVRLKESGLIKTEVFIDQDLYYYKYVNQKQTGHY